MTSIRTESLSKMDWLAVLLAASTGLIHLYISLEQIPSPVGVPTPLGLSFILAGLGFFAGILLLLLGWRRQMIYLLAIPYVLAQVVLYIVLNWPDIFTPVGIIDKAIQIVLVVVLVVLYRLETSRAAHRR